MERNKKIKPDHFCMAIFALCLLLRFIEYFLLETDKTAIGENVFHKAAGIIILAVVLKRANLTWSEIYISSFSLTGSQSNHTEFMFFVLCVFFNVINVWMEEGVFRGLFLKALSETKPFMTANVVSALLFGIWHVVMPIRSYLNREMSLPTMVLLCIGYIILSGVMGIKWGLLTHMTGSIWVGLGDHLFNNTVATNMLHVISPGGADELQIVRIMTAQLISFSIVLAMYYRSRKTIQ